MSGFTADDLRPEQAKTNIIEIFDKNGLDEIKDFDITVYGLDFNQKLYKFFTYGYIVKDDIRKTLNDYYLRNINEDQSRKMINNIIKTNNENFLKELLLKGLIFENEIDFLTREKFTTFVYNPNVHVANFRLRLENLKNMEQVHDDDWIMYDNIIKCIIYRLYLKLYPSDSKTGDQYKYNDENSMDIANPEKEKKEDIQRKLQLLEEKVRTYKKVRSLGGRTKKTIKNKLKKRKTKKMKINKKNKRRH